MQVEDSRRCRSKIHGGIGQRFTANVGAGQRLTAVQIKNSRRCRSKVHDQRWRRSKIHGGAGQRSTAVQVKDSWRWRSKIHGQRRGRSQIDGGAGQRFTAVQVEDLWPTLAQVEDLRRCRVQVEDLGAGKDYCWFTFCVMIWKGEGGGAGRRFTENAGAVGVGCTSEVGAGGESRRFTRYNPMIWCRDGGRGSVLNNRIAPNRPDPIGKSSVAEKKRQRSRLQLLPDSASMHELLR